MKMSSASGGFLIHHAQHDLRELRIELCAHTLVQFLPNLFPGECFTVAPLGRHGIIGIGDTDDHGDLRDVTAFESIRIAAAVEPLVMVAGADAHPGNA